MSKKRKKKIVLHSNHCRVKTGFGKHMKHLLTYLHKTNKYEIIEFANGRPWNDPILKSMPWKAIGSLPIEANLVAEIKGNSQKERAAAYGQYKIDDLIKEEKPDIYLGIEDIWGIESFWSKKWWSKINSIIWTPIDSLPLLEKHKEASLRTKNIIVQASFAQKALKETGYEGSHLMPVPLDTSNFYKLSDIDKLNLRKRFGIQEDDFIIGFVFRNQLRKSVPNLLEGFRLFKNQNPNLNVKLLLHTHWGEGWDIPRLLQEKNIKTIDVLTTYYCDKCKQYEIKPFVGQDQDCRFCGTKKSQQTAQIQRGVSEPQLNEIYNLMDVYCHPFTSGGQEIPIQEAKLTELVTLVTNYSCGEDYCSEESGGLPLNWTEYREPGTQFIKASTESEHICSQLSYFHSLAPEAKALMGQKAREFVIDFCSIESVCGKFEKLIDSLDLVDWDFDLSYVEQNENYPLQNIASDRDFVIDLYKNVFNNEDPETTEAKGIQHWIYRLNNDLNREKVHEYFTSIAKKNNSENNKVPFEDLLDTNDKGKRILFALEGDEINVFNSTSLLDYIKSEYPDYNIYYATKKSNYHLVNGNPNIHRVIEYNSVMSNPLWSEGQGHHKGIFNFVLLPDTMGKDIHCYAHGDEHKIKYDLNYA
jgi:glycosyltransferase involved in cell wall biosynthesis